MEIECSISSDPAKLEMRRVHSWLANSYWSPKVSFEKVIHAMENSSLVLGAYSSGEQIGYLRLVSDKTTFAWISDVYVAEACRGKGVARAMVEHAMTHPDYLEIKRWLLATRDAHRVYEALGFGPLEFPDHFMWKGTQIPEK
ncbi:MAG: GNAT family N-acetyltransferase [Ignavibacteriota bacterium]